MAFPTIWKIRFWSQGSSRVLGIAGTGGTGFGPQVGYGYGVWNHIYAVG